MCLIILNSDWLNNYTCILCTSCFLFRKVVFRGGEGALQVLPPLVDVIPEARLNLVSTY